MTAAQAGELTADERAEIDREFHAVVNMAPAELRKWLDGPVSQSVGMTPEGDKVTAPDQNESVGHHMGERIIALRHTKKADLTDADYHDMRKVVGYVHRHGKQRPHGDATDTRWRHSLMNWGHDPLR